MYTDPMIDITLIAHNIRSAFNVGSLMRTAEGFGVKEIIFTGYTPYPKHADDLRLPHLAEKITRQIQKSALGAETMVPFRYFEKLEDYLHQSSATLVALEQSQESIALDQARLSGEIDLLIGEEVEGIQEELLRQCTTILEIPMKGNKESFNVAVATGIALYELTK